MSNMYKGLVQTPHIKVIELGEEAWKRGVRCKYCGCRNKINKGQLVLKHERRKDAFVDSTGCAIRYRKQLSSYKRHNIDFDYKWVIII
jgi:hypothetical protein